MLNKNGACRRTVGLVLQLCMFLGIAMGKILCYDNCMMKNILKNKKFWKIICILAIIAYTAKNLFIGADTDEGYGIMAGYRLAMGDRLLLEMWEPHQTSAIFTAVFHNTAPRLALFQGEPHIGKCRFRHIGMAHNIVRLAV